MTNRCKMRSSSEICPVCFLTMAKTFAFFFSKVIGVCVKCFVFTEGFCGVLGLIVEEDGVLCADLGLVSK